MLVTKRQLYVSGILLVVGGALATFKMYDEQAHWATIEPLSEYVMPEVDENSTTVPFEYVYKTKPLQHGRIGLTDVVSHHKKEVSEVELTKKYVDVKKKRAQYKKNAEIMQSSSMLNRIGQILSVIGLVGFGWCMTGVMFGKRKFL